MYCGKELPVLRRLAGQEFCSDAHQRQYQQEYNDLAVGRLLDARPADAVKSHKGPITLGLADPPALSREKGVPTKMAGIVVTKPAPAAMAATAVVAEVALAHTLAPERPQPGIHSLPATHYWAAPVSLPLSRISVSTGRVIERPLEARAFVRTAPVAKISLSGSAMAKLEPTRRTAEVVIAPQVPSEEPASWQAPERKFASPRIESGKASGPKQPSAPAPAPEPVSRKPESMPEPATRAMPVTLHGVSAGKARLQPMFSALPGGAVQAPRFSALPLRPVMILAPRPQTAPLLKLPQLSFSLSADKGSSVALKVAAGVAAVALLAAGAFFLKSGGRARQTAAAVRPLPNAPEDWSQSFSSDAGRPRRISLLRASGGLKDYRVEFDSAIASKAVGWVYRAQDADNFYVSKLEVPPPGSGGPAVATHYAVINGQETAPSQVVLPFPHRANTVYKIRFQAVGNRFITWVQNQKTDEWTDDRIPAGGVGLYSEDGERAVLKSSFKAIPLGGKR